MCPQARFSPVSGGLTSGAAAFTKVVNREVGLASPSSLSPPPSPSPRPPVLPKPADSAGSLSPSPDL